MSSYAGDMTAFIVGDTPRLRYGFLLQFRGFYLLTADSKKLAWIQDDLYRFSSCYVIMV